MTDIEMLVELHRDAARQGPGGAEQTRLAIALSGLANARNLKIADIGCGTGASTLILAETLDAHITAVDFIPEFLQRLESDAAQIGVADRIRTLTASMDALPFEEAELDAIWSEGAIYNIGFEAGLTAWRKYLKPGGILAVSELTWLTNTRPTLLQAHWEREYSEVAAASEKFARLEQHGYSPIGYFVLPSTCWTENYLGPLEQRFAGFLSAHGQSDAARAIVAAERHEISLYHSYSAYFGYGYYIARKIDS